MLLFKNGLPEQPDLRKNITHFYYADETSCLDALIARLHFSSENSLDIQHIATDLVNTVRNEKNDQTSVEALMLEYDLSSEEGTVLMCLAEALLRIPDKETEDLLIRDKLTGADWEKHIGASESTFVNLTTRSLALGGKVLADQSNSTLFKKVWYGLLGRCGEPVIREAIRRSMKIMSLHFVLGRTIDEALKKETVVPFLIARLKTLALQGKQAGIYVTVDAEEAFRLEMSLDIFSAVFADPAFADWEGLGLAVQAYQKRAYFVLDYLIALARSKKKRICVRLVKGAYWDTEIKMAQVAGFPNYPVFTRKVSTDISYLACAQLMLTAQDAIYPQFATHNAYKIGR